MGLEETLPLRPQGEPVRAVHVAVTAGPDRGRTLDRGDTISVGTAPGNDLSLSDETVSRCHLELERQGDRIRVRDLGSTNGTYVADVKISDASVPPGSIVRLGRTSLKLADGDTVHAELYGGHELRGLLAKSQLMRQLMARIERVASSEASVLLCGETGSGKEVAARAIHASSPRALGPFEIVDCGSMQPTLIGSELFGHEKGAFTSADHQHIGAFERADGGTLFLDELGDLPGPLQTTLLGALERKSFRRLGGRQSISFDARIVCATHRDLRESVNDGSFRQDLYYRVAVVSLRIPALRERLEDIPLLVEHFARRLGFDAPLEELFAKGVLEAFTRHRWPGNVRELRNAVESALVMGEAPQLAQPTQAPGEGGLPYHSLLDRPFGEARAALVEEFETVYLKHLLEATRGSVSEAARRAQINRSYLSRVLKARGIRIHRSAASEDE